MTEPDNRVFVFGSNLAGRHGAGAAKWALEHRGAKYGRGIGRQGQSYAIPTKDENIKTLPLAKIKWHIDNFIEYAREFPEETFQLTPIGCGLAGYRPIDIAPMFLDAPENVDMPHEFQVAISEYYHGK